MIVVITCSLIALLFTYLNSIGKFKYGLLVGICLVTLLGCIHYNYGNDYEGYYSRYEQIARSSDLNLFNIFTDNNIREPLWVFLNYLFSQIGGFFVLIAVLNIIQGFCVYRFIKTEVNISWWPIALFIYLITPPLYLYGFSMMRQGLVVCVFLGLWPLIKQRKWLWTLILLFLCSMVHTSALVLLPFAFWGFLPVKRSKIVVVVLLVLFFGLWLSSSLLEDFFNAMMTIEEFQEYADTYGSRENKATFGFGFLSKQIPFFVALYAIWKNKWKNESTIRLVIIAALGQFIAPFISLIPLIGRVGIYFNIYSLAAIPLTYNAISNKFIRNILLLLFVILTIYSYWIFFDTWPRYKDFNTIFSA